MSTRPIDADHDDMVKIRELAQSILQGVQTLEDTDIHTSWATDGEDPAYHPAVIDYLGSVVDTLKRADEDLWGAIDDFKGEYIP